MVNDQLEIGLRLKRKRREMGLTQQDVAEYMGVGRNTTISGWESGKKKMDNQKILKLAKLYKVSIDYLLGNKGEQELETKKNIQELFDLSETDSWEKYAIVVDGQRLTRGQTKRLIAFIRAERSIENDE